MFDALSLSVPDLSDLPTLAPSQNSRAARLLRRLTTNEPVNGHHGVVYDNRDRGHSTLQPNTFPGLARLRYAADLGDGDYGLATRFRLPATVIGNSSTAVTSGARPRSLPRLAMTTDGVPRNIYSLYVNNQLYVYPEHRDHDAVDLFPANWPLNITVQGSSGSDKPVLEALLLAIAALDPETFGFLEDHGLVAPTLQMLLRRNLRGVSGAASYLSPAAHPTVFDPEALRPERMVSHASTLTAQDVAPMVRLSVQNETFSLNAGLLERSELLFDTPVAISRLWRGLEGRKRMRITAAQTRDPLGRELRFHWVLMRGDPEKVHIRTSIDLSVADIMIDWHDAYSQQTGTRQIETSRIDIAVFAEVEDAISAPSFISINFPTHQRRVYSNADRSDPQLISIDYDAASRMAVFDPALFWTAPWTDSAVRDSTGSITAWDRESAFGSRRVPADGQRPRYRLDDAEGTSPTLIEDPS